jgi:hypothetical protein
VKNFAESPNFSSPPSIYKYHAFSGGFMGLITYMELSKELSLSIRYLQKCVKEENMPCIRFGRAVRFDPKVIYAWISNHNKQSVMSLDVSQNNGGQN